MLLQKLENPALRACLNVPSNEVFLLLLTGRDRKNCIIMNVTSISCADVAGHISLYCVARTYFLNLVGVLSWIYGLSHVFIMYRAPCAVGYCGSGSFKEGDGST